MLKALLVYLSVSALVFGVAVAESDESCGDNEEYVQCPGCSPQTCASIGRTYHCPLESSTDCVGACKCISGYIRNDNNECVDKKTCTSCGGDPNAVPGCGVNCGRLCSNYQSNDTVCTTICNDGCDCKPGYVKDTNTNLCVLPENCTVN